MDRFVCIHGHFYQPPRENPWLEAVEVEDSAAPYHDWNERVTAECYAPNAASRILDEAGLIEEITNNYSRISVDVGPTLLAWLETAAPEVYRAILDADRESAARFSGHGSAIAQAHSHVIMPLANPRDRRTQVIWGIRDFERRFGRRPEGMWLPETAVDLPSLDVMVEHGIRFTILEPHQAARVRRIGSRSWQSAAALDSTMPSQVRLPSGRAIAVFFYDGPISRAVAFEGLLASGAAFAQRLLGAFSDVARPQLVHIATDGETYGHHHRFGDMALAYALREIEARARLTNYGEFLEAFPPTHEVEIAENTSWSCVHGVERWRSDCGCNTGAHPGWHQRWRAPLREAMDWLRDEAAPRYEAAGLLRDPWAARDEYIELILDRSPERVDRFLAGHAARPLSPEEQNRALGHLELQRHAMLMYASCGWFFDDISGIESTQVLLYAARAIHLARDLFGGDFEGPFLDRLAAAPSNVPERGDGRRIYQEAAQSAAVTWERLGAHYAIRSLFEPYPERARVYAYAVERHDEIRREAGRAALEVGRARFTSEVTRDSGAVAFAALDPGDDLPKAAARRQMTDEAYQAAAEALSGAFERGDFPEAIRLLDRSLGGAAYSLRSLFRDEQRRVVERLLADTLADAEAVLAQLREPGAPLAGPASDPSGPLPPALLAAASLVLERDLRRAVEEADLPRIGALLDEAKAGAVPVDAPDVGYTLTRTIERIADRWSEQPDDLDLLRRLADVIAFAHEQSLEINLWKPQNHFWVVMHGVYPARLRAASGDGTSRAWVDAFRRLGALLRVRVLPSAEESPA